MRLLYCYAAADDEHRKSLDKHLAMLVNRSLLKTWHAQLVEPGIDVDAQLDIWLNSATALLVLVSADFFTCSSCKALYLRARQMDIPIIPVLVRPVNLDASEFSDMQFVPAGRRAVSSFQNPDEAWTEVSQVIQSLVQNNSRQTNLSSPVQAHRLRRRVIFGSIAGIFSVSIIGFFVHYLFDIFPPHNRPNMVSIRPGKFIMGNTQHLVTITVPFLISETEVTQGQYLDIVGENPASFRNDSVWARRPTESVSWFDALRYCNKLSQKEGLEPCYIFEGEAGVKWPMGLKCKGYRLPTAAEWEYAARAGQNYNYAGSYKVRNVAWYFENSDSSPHPVKGKQPNAWGLYDMSGNVMEWLWDEYDENPPEVSIDPMGSAKGVKSEKTICGGSFRNREYGVRIMHCAGWNPSVREQMLGFRISRSIL